MCDKCGNNSCSSCKLTVITKRGEKGEKGDTGATGATGATGTDSPLVWNDLIPLLGPDWGAYSLPTKQPEYAFDSVKKLLYLRGAVVSSSTTNGSDVFTIPLAVTYPQEQIDCYSTTGGGHRESMQFTGAGTTFGLQYLGAIVGSTVNLILDTIPVIRLN